jgi:chaperonin GroES
MSLHSDIFFCTGVTTEILSRFYELFLFGIKSDKSCDYKISFLKCLTKNLLKMAKVKIKPLADRVLVEPAAAEEKTAAGIIIPDTAKEKPQKGTVVAVGTGKKDEPMTVKVGDKVLYGKYSGTEITIDGTNYLIMRESDIVAIV